MSKIEKILLISGKRKCGKDYVAEKLNKHLGSRAQIIRISEPIKTEWAKKLNLNLQELLSDGPYKEQYRRDMIIWSDEMRAQDYGYFCRAAMQHANAAVIIVSDIRRKTDIRWFHETYGTTMVHTLRLTSQLETRQARGWHYTPGIDDVPSECDLDDYNAFDYTLANDNQLTDMEIVNIIMEKYNL